MGRTACTEPQCLYKGALYLFFFLKYTGWVVTFIFWPLNPRKRVLTPVRYEARWTLQPVWMLWNTWKALVPVYSSTSRNALNEWYFPVPAYPSTSQNTKNKRKSLSLQTSEPVYPLLVCDTVLSLWIPQAIWNLQISENVFSLQGINPVIQSTDQSLYWQSYPGIM